MRSKSSKEEITGTTRFSGILVFLLLLLLQLPAAAKLSLVVMYERFTRLLVAVARAGDRETSKTSGKILRRRTVTHTWSVVEICDYLAIFY